MNKMMKTIANSSATARFNFQGSKEQMMQAGYYASLMGMTIDDINSAAKTTLDFEDSIASEIEAELMLNKDLNLEKLRYAALTGDSATQASELQRLVKENYKDTLLWDYYYHDPVNGPLKTFPDIEYDEDV